MCPNKDCGASGADEASALIINNTVESQLKANRCKDGGNGEVSLSNEK